MLGFCRTSRCSLTVCWRVTVASSFTSVLAGTSALVIMSEQYASVGAINIGDYLYTLVVHGLKMGQWGSAMVGDENSLRLKLGEGFAIFVMSITSSSQRR